MCAICDKPIIAATAAAEAKIEKTVTTTATNVGYYGCAMGPGRSAAQARHQADQFARTPLTGTPPWTEGVGVDGEGWAGWDKKQKAGHQAGRRMDCFY